MTARAERVGDVLGRLFNRAGWGRRVSEGRALLLWPEVVGEPLRDHARAVRIEEGKLTVAVDDSVWKQELSLLSAEIIQRMNDQMGGEVVRNITLVVRR